MKIAVEYFGHESKQFVWSKKKKPEVQYDVRAEKQTTGHGNNTANDQIRW